MSRSACLTLPVSIYLSRSASSLCLSRTLPRSICLALPLTLSISHWLSNSACFTLSTPLYLSRAACLALAVPLYLSRAACLALAVSLYLYGCACFDLSVWLCLSRSACLALLASLCLSRSAHLALPVWLCSALTQHTHHVCCRTTRDERQLAHKGVHPISLSAHSHTLSAHIFSVVSHAAHILPTVYEYTCSACLALSVSLCLFALPLSHSASLYLSRSASRSVYLALVVSLWLSRKKSRDHVIVSSGWWSYQAGRVEGGGSGTRDELGALHSALREQAPPAKGGENPSLQPALCSC